jgi:spore coat protein U-like protein
MRWRTSLGAGLVAALAAAAPARAACTFSFQDVLFGDYDASSPAATLTSAEVRASCRAPIVLTVLLSASGVSGSVSDRRLKHASRPDTLSYNLYRDAAMTTVWGDSVQGNPVTVKVDGEVVTRIHGQIFPRQDVWIGPYADTLRVTVLP